MATTVAGKLSVRYGFSILRTFEHFNFCRDSVRLGSVNAAVLHKVGEPLKTETTEIKKKIKKDEVRVKVSYCGLNVSDYLIVQGQYDVAPKLPFIPGHEVSGKITEVGSDVSKEFAVGSNVLSMSKQEFGGLAEEIVVNQQDLWTIPSSVSLKTAAAAADNYTTALLGLCRRAKIKENDVLLVSAGSGGLGLAAVDIAANVYKCKVIVICSTEERAAVLREKGAWAALTYSEKGIVNKVKEVTNGKGVQIVFDAVGGSVFETATKCVSHEGYVVVGGHAIRQVRDAKVSELLPRSFSLMGVSLRNYLLTDSGVYRQTLQDTLDMCEQELINPYISQVFKLKNVNEGFKKLEEQDCPGKILIEIDD